MRRISGTLLAPYRILLVACSSALFLASCAGGPVIEYCVLHGVKDDEGKTISIYGACVDKQQNKVRRSMAELTNESGYGEAYVAVPASDINTLLQWCSRK